VAESYNNIRSLCDKKYKYYEIAPALIKVAGGNNDNKSSLSNEHKYCGIAPAPVEGTGACIKLSSEWGHKCCELFTALDEVTRRDGSFFFGGGLMGKHECSSILHYNVQHFCVQITLTKLDVVVSYLALQHSIQSVLSLCLHWSFSSSVIQGVNLMTNILCMHWCCDNMLYR